jgi:hypothetical protein
MRSFWLVSLLFTVLSVSLLAGPAATSWELVMNDKDEGIKVYRRLFPGSSIYEFQGIGEVKAPAPKLIALFADVDYMKNWTEGLSESRLLERNFDAKNRTGDFRTFYQTFYGRLDLPWPLEDRDFVVKANMSYKPARRQQPELIMIYTDTISLDSVPVKKGVVRLPAMKIVCELIPIGDQLQHTSMKFTVHTDPAGHIPVWLVNFLSQQMPYQTIQKIRKLVLQENWDKEIEKLIYYHYERRKELYSSDPAE